MGIPKPLAIATLMEDAGVPAEPATVDAIHADFQQRMIEFYRTDADVLPIPGAEDVLRALRDRGIKVYLDTGFDRSIVDVLLGRLGWDSSVLDGSVTSDEVERGRPFPDLLHRAMELAGVLDPSEVAKVGDTPSDLAEGTAAGCALVVGVTYGTHSREQLESHPHTHLIDSIDELLGLI